MWTSLYRSAYKIFFFIFTKMMTMTMTMTMTTKNENDAEKLRMPKRQDKLGVQIMAKKNAYAMGDDTKPGKSRTNL